MTRSTVVQFLLQSLFIVFHVQERFKTLLLRILSLFFPSSFPSSTYLLNKNTNILSDNFTKYICCVKCGAMYTLEDATRKIITKNPNGTETIRYEPLLCCSQKYPNHRQVRMREPCKTPLFEEGIRLLRPLRVLVYSSVISKIRTFLSISSFLSSLHHWRRRERVDGVASDIYDGALWRWLEENFLGDTSCNNLVFSVNLDWLQPFKGTVACIHFHL
jgi:hypothetical protein